MFLHTIHWLANHFTPLNALTYITSRSIFALLTSFFMSVFIFPIFIRWLKRRNVSQPIRNDGPDAHQQKAGTPAMGGVLILSVSTLTTLLWANIANAKLWILLMTSLAFGAVGFADDALKGKQGTHHGLSGSIRLILCAIIIAVAILCLDALQMQFYISIPFIKNFSITSLFVVFPFIFLVILGTAHSANLTDGLDGLLAGILLIALMTFATLSYLSGHKVIADYLYIPYVAGAGEFTVVCAALIGSLLGFLWYNCHPASIFMGDSGALGIGAALGMISVLIHNEFLLLLCCGVMVLEALSVIIQVGSFKLRKQRVFKMAPLHHHFELSGWKEPQVIVRFWILAFLLALLTLITLKLR
jgi:phospho-N-acetylmuramoyl-pentapeptide-transferase